MNARAGAVLQTVVALAGCGGPRAPEEGSALPLSALGDPDLDRD